MSRNILETGPINVTNDNLRELLLQGNIFQNNKKSHLINLIQQIQNGNRKLYQQFVTVLIELLKQSNQRKQIREIVFDHITQLSITANHVLINDINNDLFRVIGQIYNEKRDGLIDYITLWKYMYNGKKDKQDFPNVSKTLQRIPTPQTTKVTGKLGRYYNEFIKNIQKSKQKKVQFFEDFDDSSISQSFVDDTHMSEIVYMDIMQVKAIRQRVQTQALSEENCTEYLIKMKTFLNLKSTSLGGDILSEFNKQKIWAKHFIDHHEDYLRRNSSSQQSGGNNKTNMLLISLSKDEESIDMPPANFQKNKNANNNNKQQQQQQSFGYLQQGLKSKKRIQSEINNFTINEVPIDQSRFTQRTSKNNIPVFNNSLGERNQSDRVIQKSQNILLAQNMNVEGTTDANYQRMQLQPAQKRIDTFQQISRPVPEDTLPLEESTLNNISIPVELATPMMMMLKHPSSNYNKVNTFPTASGNKNSVNNNNMNQNNNNNFENVSNSKSNKKNNEFSSSYNNNPFANSKTNYNPQQQSSTKTPYEIYKQQNKHIIDIHSPIRNRMTEDDLDSCDNLENDIIIKPHYQRNLKLSAAENNNNNFDNLYTATKYAKTQLNFYPQANTMYQNSHQNMLSQQLSPRSNNYTDPTRSNKKRLSELTSQKKQRKNNALKQQTLNYPEQYAFRPYSVHFRKDLQNFNNFKRNCLQEKFPVYVSQQLVISCVLRKVKQSRVQVDIIYQNQCRQQLSIRILYKIPKSFKIEKVTKIHRKFTLRNAQSHKFNLKVAEFPLQMCFLELSYNNKSNEDQQSMMPPAHIPLPITIKNFIQTLASSRQQWLKTYKRLTTQSSQDPFIIEKTFEINRDVVQPSALEDILGKQFMNIGASQGYSVQQLGCICHYREINNIMFLLRIAIRVDHIATLSIITEPELTNNEKDFLNYFVEILLTILGRYNV